MSGNAPLTLLESEIDIFSQHYKETLEGLLKIHSKTPRAFVFFVAGSLPFRGIFHLRQLNLFAMLSRLQDNILHKLAKYLLTTSPDSSHSWIMNIKKLCNLYQLPHPLTMLESPPSKESFKKLMKDKVQTYWEKKLVLESAPLDSLAFFKPQYMSLSSPHPIITTCGTNPYEINKAIIQLKFLSGRYRTDHLVSHFQPSSSPTCQLSCNQPDAIGDTKHLLLHCSTLSTRRALLFDYWTDMTSTNPVLSDIVKKMKEGPEDLLLQCHP